MIYKAKAMICRAQAFFLLGTGTVGALEPTQQQSSAVTRAAFDLGSGKFKLLVARVQDHHVDVTCSKIIKVELGSDLAESQDQALSEEIQKVAMQALQELKEEAIKNGATQFRGMATAVFRKARNGEAFLEKLASETGIGLEIVSQEKEGKIGFLTASALFPDLKEEEIVSWDSGNASFQIVSKEKAGYRVYNGPWGNSLVAKAFLEEVRNVPYSQKNPINPITPAECSALIDVVKEQIALPEWLDEKLSSAQTSVLAIGDNESIFAIAARNLRTDHFTIDQVRSVIQRLVGNPNDVLQQHIPISDPKTTLTRVILLCSVMEKFGIREVRFKEAAGNTLGMLIDADFWR
jgi:exopolyphosphatase / guanosine-5'-triphosphate,3'-diphosphate pyrophosphatase